MLFCGTSLWGVPRARRWRANGLHQAVEAKEGLPIQNETITLASISYQNFFLQVTAPPPLPARPAPPSPPCFFLQGQGGGDSMVLRLYEL